MTDKTKKILANLGLIFFILLPLERLLTLEIGGLTAKPAFLVLGLCVFVFIFSLPKIKLFLEEKLLFAFSALSFLTILWSVDKTRSLIISLIYLATFVGYSVLRRVITDENREKVKNIIIYVSLVLVVFSFWQYFADQYGLTSLSFLRPEYTKQIFGFPRVQASFLEPLYFANFLFLPIFFNIERILSQKKISALTITSQIAFSMIFLLTLSRGAYFGLLGSTLIILVIILFKYQKLLIRFSIAVGLSALGAILGIALIYFTAPNQSFRLFLAHSTVADAKTGESTLSRLETADVALNYFKIKPWGVGAGAFGALPEYKDQISVSGYQTVSNLYLEVLSEEGIVGFLLFFGFLLLIFVAIANGIGKSDVESLVFLGIFIAIAIQAVAFSALYILPLWGFLALASRPASRPNG